MRTLRRVSHRLLFFAALLCRVEAYTPCNAIARCSHESAHTLVCMKAKAKKKKKSIGGGGGFGAPAQSAAPDPSPPPAPLADDALKFLSDAGGNIDAAQSKMFDREVAKLRDEDPEVFEELQRSQSPSRVPTSNRASEKMTELTWDVICAFMPPGDAPPPAMARRIARVAQAARPELGGRVLDVGCGNGLLLPAVIKAGGTAADYSGCDLSSRMIAAASAAYAATGATFVHGRFAQGRVEALDNRASVGELDADDGYRAVIFSGSLQFFPDVLATLRAAAAVLLAPGGRVVLAHVNGAEFVRDEQRGNPMTVRSLMPSLDELEAWCAPGGELGELGLRVVPPDQLGSMRDLDAFYLVALERQ
jgi:SAM-dependent methyltransferase